jgi:adenosylcobinamide kinase/adenosylcobinamide-phosphate guanylyltransferase
MKMLLIGGARSGKSAWAIRYALRFPARTYIATARPDDAEMRARIARHREERGAGWNLLEAERDLLPAIRTAAMSSELILVDCLTVWVAQWMESCSDDEGMAGYVNPVLEFIQQHRLRILFITNEVGQGIVPTNPLARRYRDLLGSINQQFARTCDTVLLFTAGIPSAIKGKLPS